MKTVILNRRGFVPLLGLVILLVVAIVAAGAIYYVARPEKSANTNVAVINANVNVNRNTNTNLNSNVVANVNVNGNANVNVNTNLNLNINTTVTIPADWKTYTNAAHSYSIRYPNTWSAQNAGAYGDILLVPPTITSNYQNMLSQGIIVVEYQKNGLSTISSSFADPMNPTHITINGISATQGSDPGITSFLATYFPIGNDYVKIYWATASADNSYDQILSTFQFME